MDEFVFWLLAALVVAGLATGWAHRRRQRARTARLVEVQRLAAAQADAQQAAQERAARTHAEAERAAQAAAEARQRAAAEVAAQAQQRAHAQAAAHAEALARAEREAAALAAAEREAAARAQAERAAAQAEAERLAAAAEQATRAQAERERVEVEARAEARRRAAQAAEAAARQPATALPPTVAEAGASAAQPLVMVADDSKVVRVKTGRLLAQHQYQVCFALDGLDAVQQLQQQLPDLLITDVEMPGMDGFELTRHIRGNPLTAHIPVIMITAADDRHRERADQAGVSVLMGKPYADDALIAHIRTAMRRSGALLAQAG